MPNMCRIKNTKVNRITNGGKEKEEEIKKF